MVFQCSSCGKQFVIRSSLSWHIMKSNCGKKVANACNLSSYIQACTVNNRDKAHVYDKSVKKENTDIFSLEQIPTTDGPNKCDICGKHFVRESNLRAHRKLHERDETISIVDNENQFTFSLTLQKQTVTDPGSKPFKQETCTEESSPYNDIGKVQDSMNKFNKWSEEVTPSSLVSKKFEHPSELSVIKQIKPEDNQNVSVEELKVPSSVCNSISKDNAFQNENFTITRNIQAIKQEPQDEDFTNSDQISQNGILNTGEFTCSSSLSLNKPIKTEDIEYEEMLKMSGKFPNRLTQENIFQTEKPSEIPIKNNLVTSNEIVQTEEFTGLNEASHHKLVGNDDFSHKNDEQFRISCKLMPSKKLYFKVKSHHCDICNKGFTSLSDLAEHKSTHVEDKPYKCDACNNQFSHRSSLHKHKKEMHTNISDHPQRKLPRTENKPYTCVLCKKQFVLYSDLKKHEKIMHTGTDDLSFRCNSCGKQFKIRSSLLWHKMKQSCGNQSNINGNQDNVNLSTMGIVQESKLSTCDEIPTVDKSYKCNICCKHFAKVTHLREHKKEHKRVKVSKLSSERNVQLYHCDICDKEFTNLMELANHKLIHTVGKPYKCKTCGEEFMHSFRLTTHQEMHKRQHKKPYICDTCGKRFARGWDYSRHQKLHVKIIPYRCAICGRQYTHSTALSRHKRIHIEDRQLTCDMCGMKFIYSTYLSKHKLTCNIGEKQCV